MPATLLKKRLWHSCFLVNFAKFLRHFFKERLWATAFFIFYLTPILVLIFISVGKFQLYFTQDPLYICNSNAIHGLYTISIDISRIYSNCYIKIWVFLSDIYLCINQGLVIKNWPPWSRGSTFLLVLGSWVSELWSYNLLM